MHAQQPAASPALSNAFTSPIDRHDAEPIRVVQGQLDAYNARDIDAFAATFAPDVIVFDLESQSAESSAVRFVGRDALRERYGAQFRQHPRQRSFVASRQQVGEYVFDLEFVSGSEGRPDAHLMAVYRVRRGADGVARIDRAWFTPRL